MIEISNGRIFIDGKETVDPVLIGYSVLDYAENSTIDYSTIKEKYFKYIKNKKHRKTQEREILIDLIVARNISNIQDLINEAKKEGISIMTCYNLFSFLKKSGIADFKAKLIV